MNIIKYTDIERLKDEYLHVFTPGERITITEKIDGANASFCYDEETDGIAVFSRRQPLSAENTLRGFYDFAQTLDKTLIRETLGTRFVVFGEWLVRHSVRYPEEAYEKFYVFDVFDRETGRYCPHEQMLVFAEKLGLKTVPVFYTGQFTDWEDIQKFVGRTDMKAEPSGEGIVIKSQDRLDNKYSGTPAYVKIVASAFAEVHKTRKHVVDPSKNLKKSEEFELVGTVVTERRVEKLLQKFTEDGLLQEGWNLQHFPQISKILPKACFEDCRKEEPELVAQTEHFGKVCAKLCMMHVKSIYFRNHNIANNDDDNKE